MWAGVDLSAVTCGFTSCSDGGGNNEPSIVDQNREEARARKEWGFFAFPVFELRAEE